MTDPSAAPTVRIVYPANLRTGYCQIPASEYDPKVHTLWVDPLDHDSDGKKGGIAPQPKSVAGDSAPAGGSSATGAELPPVIIPADWEGLHHFKKIALAEALIGGDLKFSDGQTKTQAAEIIIRGVVEQRAAGAPAAA
jgi:hypothetical protein